MTIRFIHNADIRSNSHDLTPNALVGQLFAPAVLEVDDMMHPGAAIHGNDNWYRDSNGWFYWSGFAEPVVPVVTPASNEGIHLNGGIQTIDITAAPLVLPDTPTVVAVLTVPDDAVFDESGEITPAGETRLPEEEPTDDEMIGFIDWPEEFKSEREVGLLMHKQTSAPRELNFTDEQLNWGIRLLDIPQQFWANRDITGKGSSIALIGTGVATNSKDIEISDGFVLPGLGEDIADLDGMGTQAALVAAGKGYNRFGVAPHAQLLVVKTGALHHTITPKATIEGLDWAIARQADIVVILTYFARLDAPTQHLLQQKINEAFEAGIVVVAAAGHETPAYNGPQYPGAFENVLAVGACNELGARSYFSPIHAKVDLLAPGEGLNVVGYDGQTLVHNTPDTAIAAAFVGGCLALLIELYRKKNQPYTALQLVNSLKTAAFNKQKYGAAANEQGTGFGLLRLPG